MRQCLIGKKERRINKKKKKRNQKEKGKVARVAIDRIKESIIGKESKLNLQDSLVAKEKRTGGKSAQWSDDDVAAWCTREKGGRSWGIKKVAISAQKSWKISLGKFPGMHDT